MSDEFDYRSVGGQLVVRGEGDGGAFWNFGWTPFEHRSPEQMDGHAAIVSSMPEFRIRGRSQYRYGDEEKVCLFDLWKHPTTVAALGFAYPGTHQLTGSCVGAGGGNVEFTLSAVEVLRLGDPEQIVIPFWLIPYGRSRYYSGMRGRGEGSTGSGFAKAARVDGVVPATLEGLPKFTNTDGLVWGAAAEYEWSAGDRISEDWLTKSRKHLTKTTAVCRSADDVREAIVNGFPCTCASMYAHDGGKVQGTPAVLLASRRGQWAHQMSLQAWWNHPQHGEIFWLHNQWGLGAHGTCPTGAPRGGVWIRKADVDWICRDEVFAFSQFDGFPSQTFTWNFF